MGKGTREELDKGTEKKELAKGDASGQSTPDSRETSWHEIGSRAVRKDQSRWVGIPSSFVEISQEIHTSVSLHMHIGNAMLHNFSSCAWINPSILFICSLSSCSLDCISCSYEEMCNAPIGTTSWSPAVKRNGFEEDDIFGRPRGYRHTINLWILLMYTQYFLKQIYYNFSFYLLSILKSRFLHETTLQTQSNKICDSK